MPQGEIGDISASYSHKHRNMMTFMVLLVADAGLKGMALVRIHIDGVVLTYGHKHHFIRLIAPGAASRWRWKPIKTYVSS